MKEKHRIEGDNFMVSTDGGKTWKVERAATQAEKDSYAAHKAKKKDEKPKLTEEQKKPGMKPSMQRVDKKVITSGPQTSKENPISYDDETGEPLPFDKKSAGKGDDSVPLDIKPWYGDEMKTNYTPEQWREFVKSTGFKPTTKNTAKDPKAQVKEFQWYLAHHPDWKSSIDELHSAGTGKDQFGIPKKSKKKYDGYLGRRWDLLINKKPEPKKKPEEQPKVEIQPGPGVTNPARKPFTKKGYIPPRTATYAPWWMQDIVKTTGAANDLMRVKQYMPWQAEPEVYLPDATFYDPTRELAANAEQANIQTQGLAAFTGPQALSARSSAIQGQGAKNAADIMARYNNLNVGIANQLSGQRSDIMNTAAQNQANMDTQLWDKYTIANQQFDNAKNQARQHLRQSYIDAITNRAKTQALNTLYPNYYTDPSWGGFVHFKGDPNKIRPNRPDYTNEYREAFELTGSHAGAMDYLRYKKGMPAAKGYYDGYGEGYDESANYLKNQKYPGSGASYNTTTEAE